MTAPHTDPTAEEMREFLRAEFAWANDDDLTFEFDTEEAIYWFAYSWHSGRISIRHSRHQSTGQGRSLAGVSPIASAAMMLEALESEFAEGDS